MKKLGLLLFQLSLLFLSSSSLAAAGDTVRISGYHEISLVTYGGVSIFEDKTGQLSFDQVKSKEFKKNTSEIPNLGLSHSTFWLRLSMVNETENNNIILLITYPTLDRVSVYDSGTGDSLLVFTGGLNSYSYKNRFNAPGAIFQLRAKPFRLTTLYIRVQSKGPIMVPTYIGTIPAMTQKIVRDNTFFGIYIGIIIVMLFYNLFIFFSVRDANYLLYVFYIAAVGITQACLKGYGYQYIWHNSKFITDQSVFWCGALSGIATLFFAKSFLRTRETLPIADTIFNVFIAVDVVGLGISLLRYYNLSYQIINMVAFVGCIVVIVSSVALSLRGYKPAKFFLIAVCSFLVSVIIYVLISYSLVPYNVVTQNILLIGSAVEITLLSFALADKINMYKKEKEISQARALQASQEKEQLVREQNIILESKVKERTFKLERTNNELNQAMTNLKKAESQLVHAEKMASLGQLTAGIAHEINNPINFVKSNVRPLKMDVDDLLELIKRYQEVSKENIEDKLTEIEEFTQEIDLPTLHQEIISLLAGIEEGSARTADIVKGLRTFSRVDEGELKEVNIHEGLNATINLLNNIIPPSLIIEKHYGDLPLVECYPGRLNQVFMNILTNAIHAISTRSNDAAGQRIIITTERLETAVRISIADTGVGIPPDIRNKIYDPFFTTKEVGEGTGLGLSIVFSIVEKHQGQIEVNSELGKGSEFIITLPIKQEVTELQ